MLDTELIPPTSVGLELVLTKLTQIDFKSHSKYD